LKNKENYLDLKNYLSNGKQAHDKTTEKPTKSQKRVFKLVMKDFHEG